MDERLRIAELLCTRLCHDLAGPISAVNNGAEFLKDEDFNMQGQAVDLIASSAVEAVTRLQFYRQAYGKSNHEGEASLADLKKITEQFFTGSKITLDWPDTHTDASGLSISHLAARLILNAIIIVSSTLIRGGKISLRLTNQQGIDEIAVTGDGTAVKWEKENEMALQGQTAIEELSPKTIQPFLTHRLSQSWQASLKTNTENEQFSLKITRTH